MTVGIDLGGTGTRLVALDQAGEIRSRVSVPTRHHRAGDVSQLIADLAAVIQDAAGGAGLDAVGIGASGPVDPGGIIRNDATLPAYSHIPLAELITARLGVPCVIDNDAVAAALGENSYGAGQHSPALLAITLGTGIGVALLTAALPIAAPTASTPRPGTSPSPVPPRRATADWPPAGSSSPPAPPWTPPPATPPNRSPRPPGTATSTAARSSTATPSTSAPASRP